MGSQSLPSAIRWALAWLVHAFTASGAILGAWALFETGRGAFDIAIVLMLITTAIDAIDGTFARAARVSDVLPQMNGRRLDDMVDFLNFVIVPACFMATVEATLATWILIFPILASCYGFSQDDAKTDDNFFLGFPSYWNILAIYLWLFDI